jgi:hypothetical protein
MSNIVQHDNNVVKSQVRMIDLADLFRKKASYAEIISFMNEQSIMIEDNDGGYCFWYPIHYAAYYGRRDIIEYLLSIEDNINRLDKTRTPLSVALSGFRWRDMSGSKYEEHKKFIDWLLEKGACIHESRL